MQETTGKSPVSPCIFLKYGTGGDFTDFNGRGGESIYGAKVCEDETSEQGFLIQTAY
jgi:hypothetical protein